jgi:hypothetical protein
LRPFYEGIDEGVGDVVEHRPQRLFQQVAGKLVVQAEFYLAGGLAQRREAPVAVHVGEGPVGQADVHQGRLDLDVFGRKVRLEAVVVDVHRRRRARRRALVQVGAAAPGQELGIVLDPIDEGEHLRRRAFDENGFFDQGHSSRMNRVQ